MTVVHEGLEGLVVTTTALSRVDGLRGELVLAGLPVTELAPRGFEATLALLWETAGREASPADLGERRRWASRRSTPVPAPTLAAVRAALPGLLPDAPTGLDLVAAVGVATARGVAAQLGRDPFVEADPTRSHAEDLVRLALGPVGALQARGRALDAYLATVMDHGLNASTFTARVVTSTGADDLSAVVAALGALSGPLHGGAPGPVLDMLDAIGTPEAAEAWLRAELAASRRIMGMGHRFYRVRDPRVAALDAAATRLATAGVGGERLALARKVEAAAREVLAAHKPDRPLHANVELATAVLLDAIGLPREAFSSLFAAGRVGGWLAHATEQRRNGRLVRPRAAYVGR